MTTEIYGGAIMKVSKKLAPMISSMLAPVMILSSVAQARIQLPAEQVKTPLFSK